MKIQDLFTEAGTPKTPEQLQVGWLDLCSVLKAIPKIWTSFVQDEEIKDSQPKISLLEKLMSCVSPTHKIYDLFIEDDRVLLQYYR